MASKADNFLINNFGSHNFMKSVFCSFPDRNTHHTFVMRKDNRTYLYTDIIVKKNSSSWLLDKLK